MARVVKNGRSSLPGRVLNLTFPDDETLAFWKATEDGPDEYAARVARFSKALGKEQPRTAPLPPVRRLRDFATARRSHRALARVLVMPMTFDLDSRSSARAVV